MITGDLCTVNDSRDLYMEYEARPFIGQRCVFIKVTKGGLMQVALESDSRKIRSFPKRNVDMLPLLPKLGAQIVRFAHGWQTLPALTNEGKR